MAQYYVVRDKNTGLYFRGKGVNRWGKHYNQASIYRVRKMAENTIKEVSWRGEQAEVVPIQIIEGNADVVPKSEIEKLQEAYNNRLAKDIQTNADFVKYAQAEVAREIFEEIEEIFNERIAFYTDMAKQSKFTEKHYAKTMIKNCGIYLQEIAELKKKYTEDQT